MKAIILAVPIIFEVVYAAAFFDDPGQDSTKAQSSRACYCRTLDPLKDNPEYAKALQYAPILWFANDERYFPTLPFFSAFDGVDNDSDKTEKDFDDCDEIAPFDPAAKKFSKASWDRLKKWYDALADSNKRKMTTIFYRTRSTRANKIKEILFSDEQFWRRLEKTAEAVPGFKAYLDSTALITVYEYYFYYVNDEGLQGHAHDMERVFIFVPTDSPIPFRIVVGDGHGDAAPNNVLVYNMNGNSAFTPSYRYKDHLHILVELGGHSIAPDFNGDGRFDPVVDANWHSENLWGTRDVQAKVGGGATGNYASWMTFKRDDITKVFPPDTNLSLSKSHVCYRLLPADKSKDLYSILSRPSLASAFANPAQPFKRSDLDWLSKEIDYKKNRNILDKSLHGYIKDVERYIKDEVEFLNNVALGYNASNSINKFSLPPNVSSISFWTKDLLRDLSKSGIPTHRPRSFAFLAQVEKNVYPMLQFAWLFDPQIFNGVLELQAGRTISKIGRQYPELSALYDLSYGSTLSAYGKISWQHERPKISDGAISLGVSFVLPFYILEIRPPDFFRHFRLRGGIRVGFKDQFKFSNLVLKDELQIGWWYQLPIAFRSPYNTLKSRRHKIWEHASYKSDNPTLIFKPHLFRPRQWRGFGFWSRTELDRALRTVPTMSWIVPAWDFVPVKLDGILEVQAWWQNPQLSNFKKLSFQKFKNELERQKWTFALYYDRFYASKLSWYTNLTWVNHLTTNRRYSMGGGISITPLPLLAWPLAQKPLSLHWFKIRFGFRSNIDWKTGRLDQHRLELHLGLHY